MRLADAIDRARHQARIPAERVLAAAAAALRSRPPAGVEATHLDGVLARNRGRLVEAVRAKMEAA